MNRICLLIAFCLLNYGVIAQQVKKEAVPTNVVSAAESKSRGIPLSMWVFDKGEKKYVATGMRDETMLIIEVSASGKWIATNQAFPEGSYPAGVMKVVKSTYLDKGYEARNFTQVEEPGKSYYLVEVTSEDDGFELTLDNNGKILAKEEL